VVVGMSEMGSREGAYSYVSGQAGTRLEVEKYEVLVMVHTSI